MIVFDQNFCRDYERSREAEWLETNGQGGYAMGTAAGANTRRYHALLTFAARPPLERFQAVNRLEEAWILDGARQDFSAQAYPGAVYPKGFQLLELFRLDPFPVWTYAAGPVRLEKKIFMRYGENTAVVLYELLSGPPVRLEVRPVLTFRAHHGLTREDGRFKDKSTAAGDVLTLPTPAGPSLRLALGGGDFRPEEFWYRNQEYSWEERRAMDRREDAYSPGVFTATLAPGRPAAFVASTEKRDPAQAPLWAGQERDLRRKNIARSLVRGPLADRLAAAADQLIVSREDKISVLAGYPWLDDWGRDALIALPGLFLWTGRAAEAAESLRLFARNIHDGLIVNRFGSYGAGPDFRAADTSLWFIWAVQKYFQATGDAALVRELLPVLRRILEAYEKGKVHGLGMDADGLVAADGGLSWMEARADTDVLPARAGKPVEVQALWYNALQFASELDVKFGEASRGYDKIAAVARRSFREKFWNAGAQYLFDRVDGREKDATVRPNALFAVSLPYEILDQDLFRPLVETAWRSLVTPQGLKPGPDSPWAWPWLLGPFITAMVKAFGPLEATKAQAMKLLEPFAAPPPVGVLGAVPEKFFEGRPWGCPSQAVGAAELLRVIGEESLLL